VKLWLQLQKTLKGINMINLRKNDALADAVKEILQQEALKGNQHLIDKNKNNKVDAHDFKILRGEKKVNEDQVEEGNNPFDVKNYKSQLATKPGEIIWTLTP
jgi:hypothetical protein